VIGAYSQGSADSFAILTNNLTTATGVTWNADRQRRTDAIDRLERNIRTELSICQWRIFRSRSLIDLGPVTHRLWSYSRIKEFAPAKTNALVIARDIRSVG
jgi:hypothetical protein